MSPSRIKAMTTELMERDAAGQLNGRFLDLQVRSRICQANKWFIFFQKVKDAPIARQYC